MSQLEEEQLLLIEQIINQYIKDHFSNVKENLNENNNSFMFLEKSSLNLLLAHLLFMNRQTANTVEKESLEGSALLAKLDDLIEENKREFEALMDLFRNIT